VIHPSVFIAANATIIGDVELGEGGNVWFYCLLRGDVNSIRVGKNCNIQDGSILHVARDRHPLEIGDEVVLGHRVIAHGCTISNGAFIGMGAMVLNGASIGESAMVGAGAVVTPRSVIPPYTLALGVPAKVVRDLNEDDLRMIASTRQSYRDLTNIYRDDPNFVKL
jgi:carbonic anhydrase/acetyltransferase-like protein (isoleucine patch superfamily)